MKIGRDAERLATIHQLEVAMLAREPTRQEALAALQAAQEDERRCRATLRSLDAQEWVIDSEVHFRCAAAYLNGATLERGTMMIGNEVLRFHGWRSRLEINLELVEQVEAGTSLLPAHLSIPLLARVWPRSPRQAHTVRILVLPREGEAASILAVLTDLPDGGCVQAEIERRQALLLDVARRRRDLRAQRQKAALALDTAAAEVARVNAWLDEIVAEVAPLQQQRERLLGQQREIDRLREEDVLARRSAAAMRTTRYNARSPRGRRR